MDDIYGDLLTVYEIGYLIIPSVSEDILPTEVEALRRAVVDAGSAIIAEEAPRHVKLAYAMRKKNSSGSYQKYDQAYFGWIKFEVGSNKIEAVKKTVSERAAVLRLLLIVTARENTYLGKRASAMAESPAKGPIAEGPAEKKDKPPASIEEMDKSIEALVKEA